MSKKLCHVGIGSNLGNELGKPIDHINQAIAWLKNHPNFADFCVSSLYTSKAFGVTDQPDFINAVAKFYTDLPALHILDILQGFEQQAKRVRVRRWGERSLDLDLLTYGDEQIDNERLTVPHMGIFERNFVVIPMLEISPDIVIRGQIIKNLEIANKHQGLTRAK
ncbi:2-amino-4-hydroxy-6-hydroxymethyldihydropteridine pyrophosphokinase [Moraxella macacae 0408225]|uniref:2-amino-4-hydroxy-6-hydroxymethyldihydropteridine pyrophosphokinase n=1 Tax=Moraxella macacae 0408225 TaxID=1230338 RepID=L2F844_9GAMM|nr:2-amino-4-hydroxy-6-hydroxymethyldihydropteridine diphosphokinase [Moraxella macacae]ELA09244.1 2-amino-4-hydroxy-6-hydroxymethyldihydropteridine pyrophosphokinase [Moraxella macacae 0408225]